MVNLILVKTSEPVIHASSIELMKTGFVFYYTRPLAASSYMAFKWMNCAKLSFENKIYANNVKYGCPI